MKLLLMLLFCFVLAIEAQEESILETEQFHIKVNTDTSSKFFGSINQVRFLKSGVGASQKSVE